MYGFCLIALAFIGFCFYLCCLGGRCGVEKPKRDLDAEVVEDEEEAGSRGRQRGVGGQMEMMEYDSENSWIEGWGDREGEGVGEEEERGRTRYRQWR